VLAVIATAQLMVVLDLTIVVVTLPAGSSARNCSCAGVGPLFVLIFLAGLTKVNTAGRRHGGLGLDCPNRTTWSRRPQLQRSSSRREGGRGRRPVRRRKGSCGWSAKSGIPEPAYEGKK
jgi:hypothetical protein